jgi:HEPN domain-containing protein
MEKIPNAKVWILGREYLEAAESLVEEMRLWPAAVLAALSIEIFLKSFLAQEDKHGYPSTQRGHPLTGLFAKIDPCDQAEIIKFSSQIDSTYDVRASLAKFNDIFTAARYRYEREAVKSVGNDIVIFARHLCDAILELGKSRGV